MSYVIRSIAHQLEGRELTWVGECPWTGTLCFGTGNGEFLIMPSNSGAGQIRSLPISAEPINGVAFSQQYVAFSSRAEVILGRRIQEKDAQPALEVKKPFVGGAFGVAASRDSFLAPSGDEGLHILTLDDHNDHWAVPPGRPYFYKLIPTGTSGFSFAAAARSDGVIAFNLGKATFELLQQHSVTPADIIDICSIADQSHPFAVACLGRSLELLLFQNVLAPESPTRIVFAGMGGIGYSLLSAKGHVFILTDEEFVVLPRLAERFLTGEEILPSQSARTMKTGADEAFLVGLSVFLLEGEQATEYAVEALVGDRQTSRHAGLELQDRPLDGNGHLLIPRASTLDERQLQLTM
jgi:hypothetical protein